MTKSTREPIKCVMDVLKEFMSLDDEHCYLYNNKWIIPNDKELFIVLGIMSVSPIGNTLKYYRETDKLLAVTTTNVRGTYSLNIFSYDTSARTRQAEVIAALHSDIAIRSQERHSYSISAHTMNFRDVSDLEASKQLNRYVATFGIQYGETFTKEAPYWDELGGYKTFIND